MSDEDEDDEDEVDFGLEFGCLWSHCMLHVDEMKDQLSDFGLVLEDIEKDLTLVHNDLCQSKHVADAYHRGVILESRLNNICGLF